MIVDSAFVQLSHVYVAYRQAGGKLKTGSLRSFLPASGSYQQSCGLYLADGISSAPDGLTSAVTSHIGMPSSAAHLQHSVVGCASSLPTF